MMLATTNGPDCFSCSLQIRRWRWRGRRDDLRPRPTLPSANNAEDGVAATTRRHHRSLARSLEAVFHFPLQRSRGRRERRRRKWKEGGAVNHWSRVPRKRERFLALGAIDIPLPARPASLSPLPSARRPHRTRESKWSCVASISSGRPWRPRGLPKSRSEILFREEICVL